MYIRYILNLKCETEELYRTVQNVLDFSKPIKYFGRTNSHDWIRIDFKWRPLQDLKVVIALWTNSPEMLFQILV